MVHYLDSGIIATPGSSSYYAVRSLDGNGRLSAISNRVGAINVALYPGTSATVSKNLVAIPFDLMPQLDDADDLAAFVGTGVQSVLRWDPAVQDYETWEPATSSGVNFPLEMGHAYWLALDDAAPSDVVFAGNLPLQDRLRFDFYAGDTACALNGVSLPLNHADIATASDLADAISGAEQVLRWDAETQAFEYWLPDIAYGTDFPVQPGYPYHLCLGQGAPASWPATTSSDLEIGAITLDSVTGTVNQPFTITVQLNNNGPDDVRGQFRTDWYVNPGFVPDATATQSSGFWLTDGISQTETVSTTHTVSWPGQYAFSAYVDTGLPPIMFSTMTAEGEYDLYVNCHHVGWGDEWTTSESYDIGPFLRDGQNAIAIVARNDSGNGGLIFDADLPDGDPLLSDTSWQYTITPESGWCNPDFDDSGWDPAADYGAFGILPWGNRPPEMVGTQAHWIWADDGSESDVYFRRTFNASVGTYANGMIEETDEGNNLAGNPTITIGGPTPVCGSISSDTTWPLLGSPYIVTCDVTVQAGATLTIEAGTQTEFEPGTGLTVEGTLVAEGAETQGIPISGQPYGMGVDDRAERLYVANTSDGSLSVLSTVTHTELFTVPVGSGPVDVVVDQTRDQIYVTDGGDGHLRALDRNTFATLADYRVGGAPSGMAVDEESGLLFVALTADDAVAVVDGDSLMITDTLGVDCSPKWVAFNAFNDQAYVTNYCEGTVSVISITPTLTVANTIAVGAGPWKIDVDPVDNRIFVMNDIDSTISVIDGNSDNVVATVPVTGGVSGVSYDSGNDYLYVANWQQNTLTRLDGQSFDVLDTFPVGGYPVDVAVISPTRQTFVSNISTDEVTYVSASDGAPATSPLTFTSHTEAPAAPDWDGLLFESGSTGRLRHVTLDYGGWSAESQGSLTIRSDDVQALNTTVLHSGSDGVRTEGSSPVIIGGTIQESAGYGLRALGLSNPDVIANTILSNTEYAAYVDGTAFPYFVGNDVRGNGTNGIRVDGGDLTVSGSWSSGGSLPYVLQASVAVNSGVTLTVNANFGNPQGGTVVKFTGTRDNLIVNGELQAHGLPCQEVVFTSIKDDDHGGDTNSDEGATQAQAGDWGGVFVADGAEAILDHAMVGYGGRCETSYAGLRGNIHVNGGTLTMTDSLVHHSGAGYLHDRFGAIYADNGSDVTIVGSTIRDNSTLNTYAAVKALNSTLAVHASTLQSTAYGVWYEGNDLDALRLTDSDMVSSTLSAAHLELDTASGAPAIGGNTRSGNAINGIETAGIVSGTVTLPHNPLLPYVTDGLTIYTGGILNLHPGVVVKFDSILARLVIHGTLNAQGTAAQEVVLTSIQDDDHGGDTNNDEGATQAMPGDWGGVLIHDGAEAILDHAMVGYGGRCETSYAGSRGNIHVNGGTLTMTDSLVHHSGAGYLHGGFGAIYADNGSDVSISGSTIRDNSTLNTYAAVKAVNSTLAVHASTLQSTAYGVWYEGNDLDAFRLTDSDLVSNTVSAAHLELDTASGTPVIGGNTRSGNAINGIETAGIVSGTVTLPHNPLLPYVTDWLTVYSIGALNLQPGVVVKFDWNVALLDIYGTLNAQGTAAQEVVLTSIKDDDHGGDTNNDEGATQAQAGDWGGVSVAEGANVNFDHAIVSYGGRYDCCPSGLPGSIYVDTGTLVMTESLVHHSGGGYHHASHGAICAVDGADVSISGSTIRDNSTLNTYAAVKALNSTLSITGSTLESTAYGLWVENTQPTFTNNNVQNNFVYGVYNDSSVAIDAEENWWGSDTGPTHPSNPDGTGDRVSDYVDFDPFSGSPY